MKLRKTKQKNMLDELKRQYIDSGEMEHLLRGTDISVLNDFLDNWSVIKQFEKKFYADGYPRVVLCGINPSRLGAGKTGIPFIDFASLSKMMDDVNRDDAERPASFFFDVVQSFGVERFYQTFYVTNISWLGFTHNSRNVNYYQLPVTVQKIVYEIFQWEMQQVAPTTIISLGGAVKETVDVLFGESDIETDTLLPHPNYCAFPKNYERCKSEYIELLSTYALGIHG